MTGVWITLGLSDVHYEDFCHFRSLICLHYNKLSSVHTQDNMKSLLSYIVSYYLRHFDEVSDDIYPPPSMETHFSLTSDYLPPQIHWHSMIIYFSFFFVSLFLCVCVCVFTRMLEKRHVCILSLNLMTCFRHHRWDLRTSRETWSDLERTSKVRVTDRLPLIISIGIEKKFSSGQKTILCCMLKFKFTLIIK